jgi:hypothetical protein
VLTQSQLRSYWSPRCTGPWATTRLYGAGRVTHRAAITSAVQALNKVLTAYKYYTRYADTGAYNCRLNTSGTAYSLHAYGIALDLNWQSNPYSSVLRTDMLRYGDGRMPHRICAIRTNNGRQVWNWGGFWSGSKDAMHYEIVCSPADLRTGINWSTVYGGAPAPPPPPPPPPPEEANLMYRIVWFRGEPTAAGDQTDITAAYRCVYAKTEKSTAKDPYLCVEGWWIKDTAELEVWRSRKLLEINKSSAPAPLRGSIALHNGPFDNTK